MCVSLQADYFSCIATIVYIRKENCLYQACPSQDCNKKVVDQQNGMFRCEKCDKEFPNFKYRLILSVSGSALSKPSGFLAGFSTHSQRTHTHVGTHMLCPTLLTLTVTEFLPAPDPVP